MKRALRIAYDCAWGAALAVFYLCLLFWIVTWWKSCLTSYEPLPDSAVHRAQR